MLPILLITPISFVFVIFNFIYFLFNQKTKTNEAIFGFIEIWMVVITPAAFLILYDIDQKNNCCSGGAVFSPEHRIGIYSLIIFYTIAFIISVFRKKIFPPIPELLLNIFLILGIVINILLCVHLNTKEDGPILWIFGNVPIIMLLLMKLIKHQIMLSKCIEDNDIRVNNFLGKFSLFVLKLQPAIKYPVLVVLLAPVVIVFSLFLLLFGQKPLSLIKAFTDTYKHGFSQLDHLCDNVQCGGHFLCSVGANGHKAIVKPIRYGERHGGKIVCNRQLLISNAFEELIQEKSPRIHTFIRREYNKIGNFIHRYYNIFNNKIVSDTVYILMKPFEWLFLLTLYSFDNNPENRIEKQYLNKVDKKRIEECL